MPKITFQPFGVTVDCAEGESLFDVARRMGVPVATACAGKATCGLCRMKIVSGAEHLTPFNSGERKHLGNVYFLTKETAVLPGPGPGLRGRRPGGGEGAAREGVR
jgi:uncharacterized 2Fe-2S/4Fe-4S cluster protein (DUF4445 family)